MVSRTKHYINLANGIQFINLVPACEARFVRIQSTWCEQKRWADILDDLDYGFLLDLAFGHRCIVYDCSAHRTVSRALWQGIPWICYVLRRRWLGITTVPLVKGHSVAKYFDKCYRSLPKRTRKRLDYVWKFGIATRIDLFAQSHRTDHDGDYPHWKAMLSGT